LAASGGDGDVWVDFGIWAEAEKNMRSGTMTHGAPGREIEERPQNAEATPVDAAEYLQEKLPKADHILLDFDLWLANCYFAYDSSGFPVLLLLSGKSRMRVLLDECVNQRLRNYLSGHEWESVEYAGFAGLKNGELHRWSAKIPSQRFFNAM
jgi:hypothetical protein